MDKYVGLILILPELLGYGRFPDSTRPLDEKGRAAVAVLLPFKKLIIYLSLENPAVHAVNLFAKIALFCISPQINL